MPVRYFSDRIVVYKEGDTFIAVSLNFDLIAEADRFQLALKRLEDAIKGYLLVCVEDKEPDEKIYRSAPKKYQEKFSLSAELPKIMTSKKRNVLEKKQKDLLKQQPQAIVRTFDSRTLAHA